MMQIQKKIQGILCHQCVGLLGSIEISDILISGQERQVTLDMHPIRLSLYDSSSCPELKRKVARDATIIFWESLSILANQETIKFNQTKRNPLFSQNWDYIINQKSFKTKTFCRSLQQKLFGITPKQKPTNTKSLQCNVMEVMEKIQKRLSNFGSAGFCFWCPFRRRFRGLGTGEMEGDDSWGRHAKAVGKHDISWGHQQSQTWKSI